MEFVGHQSQYRSVGRSDRLLRYLPNNIEPFDTYLSYTCSTHTHAHTHAHTNNLEHIQRHSSHHSYIHTPVVVAHKTCRSEIGLCAMSQCRKRRLFVISGNATCDASGRQQTLDPLPPQPASPVPVLSSTERSRRCSPASWSRQELHTWMHARRTVTVPASLQSWNYMTIKGVDAAPIMSDNFKFTCQSTLMHKEARGQYSQHGS